MTDDKWDLEIFSRLSVRDVDAVLSLGWPAFVVYRDLVFLAEAFSEAYADRAIAEYGEQLAEATVNLTYVDTIMLMSAEDSLEAWEDLARLLSEMWLAKAAREFPARAFEVAWQWYSTERDGAATNYFDLGISIFQKGNRLD